MLLLFSQTISTNGMFVEQNKEIQNYENTEINNLNYEPWNGYTLYSPMYSTKAYLLNMEKEIVHTWNCNSIPGESAYLLENGNLLRTTKVINPYILGRGSGGGLQEISPEGNVIWEFEYSDKKYLTHHDIEVLPNGNILMIAWEVKSKSQAISAGRDPNTLGQGELWSEHIIEVEPYGSSGGNIVWEWHVWDHLVQDHDPTKDNYGIVRNHPELIDINFMQNPSRDWLHINSIDYNEEFDQILLSVYEFSEIWVIEHGGNSDLLYRWGNPQAYRAGDSSDQKLYYQHDAQWIQDGLPGAGKILYFNNGVNRPEGRYSSVEEINPPVTVWGNYQYITGFPYGPAEQDWIYIADNPTDFFSAGQSGVQRLPNGNTLICEAHGGRFFEIDQNENIVWQYTTGTDVFKIHRYNPNYPGINVLLNNSPPNKPDCYYNKTNDELVISSIDPDDNQVKYGISWNNNGIVDKWTEFHESGEEVRIDCEGRTGIVKVIAEDQYGAQSDWMQLKSKKQTIDQQTILNYLVQHSNLFILLRQIIKPYISILTKS